MTKEITKAYILQELQDKFGLREFDPQPFLFSESVLPIYDIGKHLLKWGVEKKTVSITGTNGKLFFTVPQNEKWYLRAYNIYFLTGAYTIAGAYLLRTNAPADSFYLDLEAAQSASYLVNLPVVVSLDPGDKISINVDGYTSTGNLQLNIDVAKEEVR